MPPACGALTNGMTKRQALNHADCTPTVKTRQEGRLTDGTNKYAWPLAGVYDSTGILPGPYTAHSGIVIDNGKKNPVFLIEKEDRSSVQKKRDVLNGFFNARTRVLHVYRMQAVEGGVVAATISLADSPVKKMKKAAAFEDMDVDELQEEYKAKLGVTQVRGPKARDRRWLIDKINGGLTVRAKRAQDKQGGGGKRARN